MKRFLTGKDGTQPKRRMSDIWEPCTQTDDTDTDTKLALLTSLYPDYSLDSLLELLLASQGSTKAVCDIIDGLVTFKPAHQNSLQTSVTEYCSSARKRSATEGDGKDDAYWTALHSRGRQKNSAGMSKVIHLYSSTAIEALMPCTFHPFVLPAELANDLLSQLLSDSVSWKPNRFRLFNREVSSPHTTCFYANPSKVDAFRKEYRYYGDSVRETIPFTEIMIRIQHLVEKLVNEELVWRGHQRFQHKGRWTAEVAFCNRYDGPNESVGYHSDTLTYLGPMPVIASLSLGVTREFRLRHRSSETVPTYSIHLPHNSLLIMHAPCQEDFKHSVVPSRVIDVHPISGSSRFNITYRMYRTCFAPSKTPICKCGVPMNLRSASKPNDSGSRYFWTCSAAYQKEQDCKELKWANFNNDGEPLTSTDSSHIVHET
ncbi:hypothetical protein V1512DRAFT_235692 [Lipomyces arxii]|uniref:uncharacterized protein n=1 Tax=Lipomyces arxii TaxID=56418 RepID=UPI0034CEBA6C